MTRYVSHWRETAAKVIASVLVATAGLPEKSIRAALKAAYPFGERAMHPYKIWCDEVRIQRGLKKLKVKGIVRQPKSIEGQGKLFGKDTK